MDFINLHKVADETKLKAGSLLIAEPLLADPNFSRSVIFICESNEDGAVGFVLNRPTEYTLGDLLPELSSSDIGVNQGGPVQLDTLHMLHRIPDILGGTEILPGVFWGGAFDALQEMIYAKKFEAKNNDVKLFLGYSGWSPGQLEEEIKEGSWLIADISEQLIFETDIKEMWKHAIHLLGDDYRILANMPINPQLN